MLKRLFFCVVAMICAVSVLTGCEEKKQKAKVGVSMGVGPAVRWTQEAAWMEERAKELGMDIEIRVNKTDKPKTQTEDCFELINSGIDVLILVARDVKKVDVIVDYATKKKVKVISYARAVLNENITLFIGYDIYKVGQSMGKHLVEKVHKGDFILLKGDENDVNAHLQYHGAMRHIEPLVKKGDIRLLCDAFVPGWSAKEGKRIVMEALNANGGKVDAIYAPNDILAGACAEAMAELGLDAKKIPIVGMDAELPAIQRLIAGTQDATVYMDLQNMAYTAINEAHNMAIRQKINTNSEIDSVKGIKIDAYLINGQMIVRENVDKILVDKGIFTREQVYGQ